MVKRYFEVVKDVVDYVDGITINVTSQEAKSIPGLTKAGTYCTSLFVILLFSKMYSFELVKSIPPMYIEGRFKTCSLSVNSTIVLFIIIS